MTRLAFPDEGTRQIVSSAATGPGQNLRTFGSTAVLYTAASGGAVADLRDSTGAALATAGTLTIGPGSLLPDFQGPDDSVTRVLYASIDGSTARYPVLAKTADVVTAIGNATYSPLAAGTPKAETARRIASRPPKQPVLSALKPTITVAASSAISSGILRAPKRLTYNGADGAYADLVNDPHFAYFGVPDVSQKWGTVFPDYNYLAADSLTGIPSSQIAQWTARVGTMHVGSKFEIPFLSKQTTALYRLTVNDQPLSDDFVTISGLTANSGYYLGVDFSRTVTDAATTSGSPTLTSATAVFSSADVGQVLTGAGIPAGTTVAAVVSATSVTMSANATATASGVSLNVAAYMAREIVFEYDLRFGGFLIEPSATLQRLSRRRVRIATLGDSLTGGSGPLPRLNSAPEQAAKLLDCTHFNLGVGGTGAINTGGTGGATAATRIASDLVKAGVDPDIVLYWNGYNDAASNSQAAITAAVTADLAAVVAAKPNAIVIAIGCYTPGDPGPTTLAANNAVKAAVAATPGTFFIDMVDTTNGGFVTTWVASNGYRPGDIVLNGSVLYECLAFTNAATFDATKFRGITPVNGTGRVGATTGVGNADVAVHTDSIHPTLIGGKILGAFFARRIYDICRSLITPNVTPTA